MTVNYITIKGFIKDGELNIDLPENVMDGEIEVKLPVAEDAIAWEDRPWMEDELTAMLKFEPATLGEILEAGLIGQGEADWSDVEDSAIFVEELRRKQQEHRISWTD